VTRRFVKMQGTGNDFVVIDARDHPFRPGPERVRWIADRRRGIGCDQVLVIESMGGAIGYRVYNADGSPAVQCGNGARCVARYLADRGALGPDDVLATPAGPMRVDFEAGLVGVTMGRPVFDPARVPFAGSAGGGTVEADGETWAFEVVSLGNPHAVLRVPDVQAAPVAAVAAALQGDPRFGEGVNVGFCEVLARDRVRLRVVERGAGETQACGSGACAAVALGRRAGDLDPAVSVALPGGSVRVSWPDEEAPMRLAGLAEYAFTGAFEENDLT